MDYLQLILLSLLQGITEFLPISSSAHLILLSLINGQQEQRLALEVAAHFGTLAAVIHYLWHDIKNIVATGIRSLPWQKKNDEAKLFWFIVLATLPVLIIGFLGHTIIVTYLREPLLIAVTTILFAILLWWSDAKAKRHRNITTIYAKDIIYIALAQALALIPGTSRSGIVITAALILGFDRQTAARISLFLSIPVIFIAGCYETFLLIQSNETALFMPSIIVMLVSALTALLTIKFFLALIEKTGMLPYVIYRLFLGATLLYYFL